MTPDFEKIASLLHSNNIFNSVSELHGIISGQLCAGASPGDTALCWRLLGQESRPGKVINELILRLQTNIYEQFTADDYTFQPLLPDDDEEMSIRLHALGNWCEGFIAGFGGAYAKGDHSLLEETREVLKDFTAIANIDDDQHASSDNEEQEFMEVSEYVRMAACAVFLQNNTGGSKQGSQVTDTSRIH